MQTRCVADVQQQFHADRGFYAKESEFDWPGDCSIPWEDSKVEVLVADHERWEAIVLAKDGTETSWACRVSGLVQGDSEHHCRPTRHAWLNRLLIHAQLELK
jgi:hypothetical protein